MPLWVIRRGAAAVGPFGVPWPDRDTSRAGAPVRVRVPDPDRVRRLAAFDAQLHRQLTAAGFPAKPLPNVGEILVNFGGRAHGLRARAVLPTVRERRELRR